MARADASLADPLLRSSTKSTVSQPAWSNPAYVKSQRLSVRVALLICIFFAPVVFEDAIGSHIFGDSCEKSGRICGFCLSQKLKVYWPNVVQLMFFTIYSDLGNTVKLAWQGVCGTLAVGLNRAFLATLFPEGGKCKQGSERLFGVKFGLRLMCEEFVNPNYERYQWFVWLDVLLVLLLVLGSNAQTNTMVFALSWHTSFLMEFMSPDGYVSSSAVEITTLLAVTLAILTMLPLPFRLCNTIEAAKKHYSNDFRSVMVSTGQFIRKSPTLTLTSREAVRNDMEYRICQLQVSYHAFGPLHSSTWWEVALIGTHGAVRRSLWVFKECIGDSINIALMVMLKAVQAETSERYQSVEESIGWKNLKASFLNDRNMVVEQVDVMNKAICNCIDFINLKSTDTNISLNDLEAAFEDLERRVKVVSNERKKLEDLAKQNSIFLSGSESQLSWSCRKHRSGGDEADRDMSHLNSSYRKLRNNLLIYIYSCLVISYEASKWPDLWKAKMMEVKNNRKHAHTCMQLPEAVLRTTKQIIWEGGLATWGEVYSEKNPWKLPWKSRFSLKLNSRFSTEQEGSQYWCPFWVNVVYNPEKRSFVLTNTFAIYLVFVLGNIFDGGVWTPYSATMPSLLGVLISQHASSAINKNLMRLLGIVLGKVIPIMLIAFVALFKSSQGTKLEGGIECWVHLFVMFLYMAFFANVYYTSPHWSFVGCLVAGFGCYAFVGDQWSEEVFATRYQEIGQVTFAICVQFVMDLFDLVISKSFPRDKVVANLRKIGCGVDDEAYDESHLIKVLNHCLKFHDEEALRKMTRHRNRVHAVIERQKVLANGCADNAVVLAGYRGPFKMKLHSDTLGMIEKIEEEVDILYLVKWHVMMREDAALSGEGQFSWTRAEIKYHECYIMETLPIVFERLLLLFEHTGTNQLEEDITYTQELDFQIEFKDTLSLPLCVARRTLSDIRHLIGLINHACFASGYIKTNFGDKNC